MTDTIQTLRQRLEELRSQHAAGSIGNARYAKERAPLERQLVDLLLATPQAAALDPAVSTPRSAARPGARLWAVLGAFAVLLAATGYWWTGSPSRLASAPSGFGAPGAADEGAAAASAPHAVDKEQFAAMTQRLAARLSANPTDADGWAMLGRSYMAMGQEAEAVAAFARVVELRPNDANALTDYADLLAVQNGRQLEGEPMKLIERALKIEPDNLKALALAGTAAYNRGDYARAAQLWDRAASSAPAESPIAEQVRNAAAEAREKGNLPAAVAADKPVLTVAAGAVSGVVSLAPALQAQVAPDDTVFIFARRAEGSRMPLAILRKSVKDLPFAFKLDDSLAMSPAAKLSGAGRVVVGARVSKSGQAMPQPGDLEGLSGVVAVGSTDLKVVIAGPATK
jgi:cytochrome c-type biogenesis protein CcmH